MFEYIKELCCTWHEYESGVKAWKDDGQVTINPEHFPQVRIFIGNCMDLKIADAVTLAFTSLLLDPDHPVNQDEEKSEMIRAQCDDVRLPGACRALISSIRTAKSLRRSAETIRGGKTLPILQLFIAIKNVQDLDVAVASTPAVAEDLKTVHAAWNPFLNAALGLYEENVPEAKRFLEEFNDVKDAIAQWAFNDSKVAFLKASKPLTPEVQTKYHNIETFIQVQHAGFRVLTELQKMMALQKVTGKSWWGEEDTERVRVAVSFSQKAPALASECSVLLSSIFLVNAILTATAKKSLVANAKTFCTGRLLLDIKLLHPRLLKELGDGTQQEGAAVAMSSDDPAPSSMMAPVKAKLENGPQPARKRIKRK